MVSSLMRRAFHCRGGRLLTVVLQGCGKRGKNCSRRSVSSIERQTTLDDGSTGCLGALYRRRSGGLYSILSCNL